MKRYLPTQADVPSRFRRGVFTFTLAVAMATQLTGCLKPQTHDPATDSKSGHPELEPASFDLARVNQTKVSISRKVDGFSIPQEKIYTFEVCATDKHTRDPLIGHPFEVTGMAEPQQVHADSRGCLAWSERVGFNFIADQKYLELRRVVRATGVQTGARILRLAVNPWDDKGEFFDLDYDKIDEGLLVVASDVAAALSGKSVNGGAIAGKKLFVANLPVVGEPIAASEGWARKLTLDIKPSMILKNPHGQAIEYGLVDARLQIEAALFATTPEGGEQKRYLVWKTDAPVEVKREGDFLRSTLQVAALIGNANTMFSLALRVTPVRGPEGLLPFEGLFQVGDFHQITGAQSFSASLRISNSKGGFAFAEAVQSGAVIDSATVTAAANASSSGGVQAGLPSGVSVVKPFRVSSLMTTLQRERQISAVRRAMQFSTTVCLRDTTNGDRSAADMEFSVKHGDKTEPHRAQNNTNGEGCISWVDEIEHNYYASEKFFLRPVTIKHERSGYEETLMAAYNPWDPFGASRDMMVDADREIVAAANKEPAKRSLLLPGGYTVDSILTRSYEVDEFLNLQTIKRIRVSIPMSVQRVGSIRAGRNAAVEPLRPGIFLYRAALYLKTANPYGEPIELVLPIRDHNRLMKVETGMLRGDVEFAIPHIELMKVRTDLAFEIQPIDEDRLRKFVQENSLVPNGKTAATLTYDELISIPVPDVTAFIDRDSEFPKLTFVTPAWIKDEKDFGSPVSTEALAIGLPDGGRDAARSGSQALGRIAPSQKHPLAGRTIDDIYARADQLQAERRAQFLKSSRLSLFLQKGNLEYVPVLHEAEMYASDPTLEKNNRLLPQKEVSESLLKFFKRSAPIGGAKPITKASELLDFVEGRRNLDGETAVRLCVLFKSEAMRKMLPKLNVTDISELETVWRDDCRRGLIAGVDHIVTVERKARVFELETNEAQDAQFRTVDYAIQAGIGFGRSIGLGASASLSWNPMQTLGGAATVLSGGLGKALSAGTMEVISNMFGFSMNLNASHSMNAETHRNAVFASELPMTMEQTEVSIKLKKYEQCVVVRANTKSLLNDITLMKWLTRKADADKAGEAISRGLFICAGRLAPEARTVRERYYALYQLHLGKMVMDEGDLRSNPYLFMLRGQRDYVRFLLLAEASQTTVFDVALHTPIGVGQLPFERMSEVYDNLWRSQSPTLPGYYTIEETKYFSSDASPKPKAKSP